MSGCEQVHLREIMRVSYGKGLTSSERDLNGDYCVYGSSGIVGRHSQSLVSHPTLIIGRKGSVGSVTYAPNGGWPIDTTFYTENIDSNKVDLRYLFYALRQAQLHKYTITTSIPGLSRDDIYRTKIPLPPLPEQRRIAAILDKADALRRKRQEAIRLSEQFLRSVFLDMFGDPVTNPKGWPISKLGSEARLDRGRSKHRPRNAPELLGGPYPLIQTGDIANSDGLIDAFHQTYSEEGLKQSRLWPKGTLCITIAANIANTAILGFDSCFPDSVVGLVPGERLNVSFVRYWFELSREQIDKKATQVAQKNINLEILRDIEIYLPPLGEQHSFGQIVDSLRRTRQICRKSFLLLQNLNRSLTQCCFQVLNHSSSC